MIRITGAVLIMLSGIVLGMNGVKKLRWRVRSLSSVTSSLSNMSGDICTRLTPMRDVLAELSENVPEPASLLYKNALSGMDALGEKSFYSIWRTAVENTKELKLTREEADTLSELGTCLGRYDVKEQARSIAYTAQRMEMFLHRAEAERDRDTKVHAFFGIASGLFAVVILL